MNNKFDEKEWVLTKADIELADDVYEVVRISKITGKPVQKRGFAAMSIEKRTDLARKGGASVDPNNRSFSKNRDLAATAGRKGGFGRHKASTDD